MIWASLRWIWKLPRKCIRGLVRFYQVAISPMFPPACKYQPSCSAYMIQAIEKYGAVRGTLKGLWRICRCNPWSKGGEDHP